jgi:hypothetical protein
MTNYTDEIDGETGTTEAGYVLTVLPTIEVSAETAAGPILDTLNPALVIATNSDSNGSYISIDLVNATKTGSLYVSTVVTEPGVQNQRFIALAATVISLAIAALFAGLFLRNRAVTSKEQKPLSKVISPYKDMISETTQSPPVTKTTIEMKSLEDLSKTAEILARPIMYNVGTDGYTFFLIDGETIYLFRYLTNTTAVK